MRIVDLTVPIGSDTFSPPSVNQPIGITKHYRQEGETAEEVTLDRTCGATRRFSFQFLCRIPQGDGC